MSQFPHQILDETHRHAYISGKIVLPLSNGGHTVATLHDGYSTRTVKFRRARKGLPPVLPKAETAAMETLLGSTVYLPVPHSDPSQGVLTFDAEGQYDYVSDSPRIPGTNVLPTGSYPVQDTTTALAAKQAEYAQLRGALSDTAPTTQPALDSAISSLYSVLIPGNPVPQWRFTMIPTQFFTDSLQG